MRVAITGASRGIGRATALALRDRGCTLDLVGRDSPALESLRREVPEARFIPCELASSVEVERAGRALCEGGPPDVLINNAAIIQRAALGDVTQQSWDEHLAVNLTAPFLLTRAVLPGMLARDGGRIVHVSSISATLGTARSAPYNATKWALVGFMKSVAEELADTRVFTCALLPGSVDTEMLQGSGFAPSMTAQDVAQTLVFLALDAPRAHNGAVLEMFGT